jgi:hypothetical protein
VDDFGTVEPVFQLIFAKVWASGSEDLGVLNSLPPIERAIYATRLLEGDLDNGGWYQAFGNGKAHLIEPAIEGYQLLGLPMYAAHLRRVRAVGFDGRSEDAVGDALDKAYFALSGSEAARAAVVRRHPWSMDGNAPNLLTAAELFELFRSACPSFVQEDDALLADWRGEPVPGYARASALARHLVELASSGQMASVEPVLALVERAIEEGDPYTSELAVIGVLEDTQNVALYTEGGVRLVDLRRFLGPKSMEAWDLLMRDWHGEADEARKRLPPGSLPD